MRGKIVVLDEDTNSSLTRLIMVRDSAKGTGRKKKTIEKVYGVAEIKDELIDVALLSQFFMIIENRRKQKFENWKSMR